MEIKKNNEIVLEWEYPPGLFEARIWNGKIASVNFYKDKDRNSSIIPEKLFATVGSEEFLKDIYTALGELLSYLEKIKKENEQYITKENK